MPEPVAWSYVDDRRTHRVDTMIQRARTLEFVIQERDLGSDDPEDVYVERHALVDAWEARVHQLTLEARLALLGSYRRSAGVSWTPLRAPVGRALDLEPLDLDGEGSVVEFHHYQSDEGRHAVTLVAVHEDVRLRARDAPGRVAVHEELPRGKRALLARLDYSYPDVDGGNLQLLHPRLPPVVYRSALASQHLELRELRFSKVRRVAGEGMGARSWTALRAVLETILARLVEGRLDATEEGRREAQRGDPITALEAIALARRTKNAANVITRTFAVDDEMGPTNAPVEGRKPAALMEELGDDIVKAMNEPRLLALHARFLPPGEDRRLIEEGELAILRAMRAKREAVPPRERHLVSLLEASLLLRRALMKRTRVDAEVINRVRHAGAYL